MTERLSQSDVDVLVRRSAPPSLPLMLVLPWNFQRPARLQRERRLLFESVLSETARGWQSWLSSRLQMPVEVVADVVEPVPLAEWLESFDEPSTAFAFSLGGRVKGSGLVDLGAGLAFAFIDRLLGGPGEPSGPNRPLTALEQALVRGPVERLLMVWRDAGRERFGLDPAITSFEPSPGTITIVAEDAPMIVSHLAVRTPAFSGLIAIGAPLDAMEPTATVAAAPSPALAAAPRAARARVELGLQQARVTVSLRLPPVRLSARSVLGLKPGQIIETSVPVEGPVELHVNGKPCFTGTLGQRRKHLGMRVTTTLSSGASGDASRGVQGRVR